MAHSRRRAAAVRAAAVRDGAISPALCRLRKANSTHPTMKRDLPLHQKLPLSAHPHSGTSRAQLSATGWLWRWSVRLLLPLAASTAVSCVTINYGSVQLQEADRFFREGRYEEAIAAYRTHMQNRLQVTNRPRWENPYFYLLLIGDAHLGKDDPFTALENYEEAERHDVSETLISDRYRAVARWYEQRGELTAALALLRRFRDRDSLLFDAMLDRVARSLTAQEDAERQAAAKSSPAREGAARGAREVRGGAGTSTPIATHMVTATPTTVGTPQGASLPTGAVGAAGAAGTPAPGESPVSATPSAGKAVAGNEIAFGAATPLPMMSLHN